MGKSKRSRKSPPMARQGVEAAATSNPSPLCWECGNDPGKRIGQRPVQIKTKMHPGSGAKVERHADAIRIFAILSEWRTLLEPEVGVQRARRSKGCHRSRLQAQTLI